MTKKNCDTSDSRQIWPTGKLRKIQPIICLVPVPGEFWASPNDFFKSGKNDGPSWKDFVAGFAKNESLYRRISTKYKSSKLFWKILEDTKQNKRENRGKKTVRISDSNSPSRPYSGTHSVETPWNPSRWAFCLQSLAYFDDLYQWIHVCLFLTRYFTEKLKSKASFKGKYRATKWR